MERRIDIYGRRRFRQGRAPANPPVPSGAPAEAMPRVPAPPSALLVPQDPTWEQMVANFGEALSDWRRAGYPLSTLELARERREVCKACPLWDGSARLGLGKCRSPKCGCTRVKVFLKSAKCPEAKWRE